MDIRLLPFVAAAMLAGACTAAPAPSADAPASLSAAGRVAAKLLFRDPVFDGAADPVLLRQARHGGWIGADMSGVPLVMPVQLNLE